MRTARTALAALLVLSPGCSLAEQDFRAGSVADSSPVDSTTGDVVVGDGTPDTTSDAPKIDSRVDGTIVDSSTDAEDTSAVDTGEEVVDVGPDGPAAGCTFAGGGPNTICVPEQTFDLGANNVTACAGGCAQEKPTVSVKVSYFFMDDAEVTVGRFRTWWNKSPRPFPASNSVFGTIGGKDYRWKTAWPTAPTEPATGGQCTWPTAPATDATNDAKVLNCVDWYTALAFCISDGKRLPTEAEFESEASAGADRLFPWSPAMTETDAFTDADVDCAHGIAKSACGTPLTYVPGSTIWGRSYRGAWNLAGGVAEWMLDGYVSNWSAIVAGSVDPITDPTVVTTRVVRGGAWNSAAKDLRATARPASALTGSVRDETIGFRCAKR